MTLVRTWWPVAGSGAIILIALLAAAHTRTDRVELVPLPAGRHITARGVVDLGAEISAPLLAPTRSDAPAAVADAPPPTPPPALVGIVAGGGHAVALIKSDKGETVIAHIGDVLDGWTVAAITKRQVTFERSGTRQDVELIFTSSKKSDGTADTPPAAPSLPALAHSPSSAPSSSHTN